MQIQFVGATERVTGSCAWMKYKRTGIEFLIDCGMVQGENYENYENNKDFPFKPRNLKFVLLTHAHLDHCGLIPRLYKEGFRGKVICTNATARLTREILMDSAKQTNSLYTIDDVYRIDFELIDSRRDFKWAKPIAVDKDLLVYFQRSAHILGSASIGICWNKNDSERNDILFTGDIGNNTVENSFQPLLKYRQKPFQTLRNIVIESTYGNRDHNPEELSFLNRIEVLEHHINRTLAENNGQLIIPAFSMHRTQEILFDLYYLLKIKWKNNPVRVLQSPKSMFNTEEEYNEYILGIEEPNQDIPKDLYIKDESQKYKLNPVYSKLKIKAIFPVEVICDSALAKNISKIYADELCRTEYNQKDEVYKYPYRNNKIEEWLSSDNGSVDELMKGLYRDDFFKIGMHSIKYKPGEVTTKKAKVIVTSSGMCDNGPVLGHLERILGDEKSTILLTGYQSNGTNGRVLSELATMDSQLKSKQIIKLKNRNMFGDDIRARIEKIGGYFGHSDQKSLIEYLFKDEENKHYVVPNIFLNHGNDEAREIFKNAIYRHSASLQEKYKNTDMYKTNIEIPVLDNRSYDLDNQCWVSIVSLEDKILMLEKMLERCLE